jgi:hypothetical protein
VKNVFKTEEAIIQFVFNVISNDKWAASHCIGFLFEKEKNEELKNKLKAIDIEFHSDEIPDYGIENPAYRVFVCGCDINKVEYLRSEYYKPVQ